MAFDERFDRELDDLTISGRSVEVINASVSAWSTDQEYLLLEQIGGQIQPDLVLLGVNENDLVGNMRDAIGLNWKPSFRAHESGLATVPRNWLHRFSAVQRQSDLVGLLSLFGSRFRGPRPTIVPGRAHVLLERLVEETGLAAVRLGAEFVVAVHSNRDESIELGSDWKPGLRELARAHGWSWIDLDTVLESDSNAQPVYFENDPIHWNPRGHAAVGRLLRAYFEAR